MMERIVILGTSGSGKSTLARRLATRYALVHVELDAFVHGPGWATVPPDRYRNDVEAQTATRRWVADGNYFDRTADWLWPSADTVIWLDMPLWRIVPRLIRRSLVRIVTREELWNGNQERLSALIGRDSVVAWALRSHRTHSARLPGSLAELKRAGIATFHIRSPRELESWWSALTPAP